MSMTPLNPAGSSHLSTPLSLGKKVVAGERLLEASTHFLAWYSFNTWNSQEPEHKLGRQFLMIIQRIAEVSKNGGGYLSLKEEEDACNRLEDLNLDVNQGAVSSKEIPGKLRSIIEKLTKENHKALLVTHVTALEFILCIYPTQNQDSKAIQLLLNETIQRIKPDFDDSYALAVAQGLSKVIETPPTAERAYEIIKEAVEKWM